MRITPSAFMAVLAIVALPSLGVTQVLTLDQLGYRHRFDRKVPVATVSLVDDIVSLGGGRIVQDPYGEPFVLGAAALDVRLPHLAKVVFTITNPTQAAIPLKDVVVYERTMVSSISRPARDLAVGAPYMPLSALGVRAARGLDTGEELAPGASLTVEVPISAPGCDKAGCDASGFVVFVGRKLPHADDPRLPPGRAWLGDNPLFTRAFLSLLSQPKQ